MRRSPVRLIVWVVAGLLLLYLVSPYWSFWQLTKIVRSHDATRLENRVDFRAVRESLKQQLRGKVPHGSTTPADRKKDPFSGLLERLAPALIDQLVDAFITPEGLAALIADPQLAREAKAKDPAALVHAAGGGADKDLGWSDVKYAFFTGPRNFLVDTQGVKLRFRFSKFRWILNAVELPLGDTKP
ncbi:MAG: DUF2939 domain-containing protein [Verrucomicrobiota bacterium]|nr:DUF2939 domain-containing protein [Verrucomicrobiota bacterium]